MKTVRFAWALACGIACAAALSPAADAATKRFFDPVTRTFITYDANRAVQRQAAPKARAPAAQRQARVPAAQRLARLPAAQRQAALAKPPKLRFRPFEQAAFPQAAPSPRARPAQTSPVARPTPGPEFDRQIVEYETTEAPGTIIIDTGAKFLYYVQGGGEAIRYGVGVGKEGFGWTGTVAIGAMREWPKWFPPAEMVGRRPELAEYMKVGMSGGEQNPLGARALYLHDNGRDTLFRIHGTNEPWSIGLNVSSGCIRMLNENVIELYTLAKLGAKVIVA